MTQLLGNEVTQIDNTDSKSAARWKINLDNQRVIETNTLVLTTGHATRLIPHFDDQSITPARGQLSHLQVKSRPPACVISGKRYVIPNTDSVYVGATFARHNLNTAITAADNQDNLQRVRHLLPDLTVNTHALAGFVGIRATTPDRFPIVGPAPNLSLVKSCYHDIKHGRNLNSYPRLPVHDGLYLINGLGSRGIVTAPFVSRLLSDYLLQPARNDAKLYTTKTDRPTPSNQAPPIPATSPEVADLGQLQDWFHLLNPARFLIKRLKRGLVL